MDKFVVFLCLLIPLQIRDMRMFTFCQTAARPHTHSHTRIHARRVLGLDHLASTYFFSALFRGDASHPVKVVSSGLVVLDRPAVFSLWRPPRTRTRHLNRSQYGQRRLKRGGGAKANKNRKQLTHVPLLTPCSPKPPRHPFDSKSVFMLSKSSGCQQFPFPNSSQW